jgi:3-mercaptopyruvate sulfurtransferase SseA
MGYENVREYAGGKQDWMRVGLPVEREHREELAGTDRVNEEASSWTVDRMITVGVIVILALAFVVVLAARLF